MNLLNQKHLSQIHPIQMGFFIAIELLLIFGKEFSKFQVVGPLHLYDLVIATLGLCSLYAIIKKKKFKFSWPIITFLGLSLIYLGYSIIAKVGPFDYILRHYALYIYMGASYLIFLSYISGRSHQINLRFMILIAIASMAIQIIYLIYLAITSQDFDIRNFNYFSPMVIMGVLTGLAFAMTYSGKILFKVILFVLTFFVILTFGHASAFLAALCIIGCYFFIRWSLRAKIILVAGFIVMVWAFISFMPQFSDVNATFRVVFWKNLLKESVSDYYGILGHGFGGPYASEETFSILANEVGSQWYDYRPEDRYLVPSHNSFLTIAFHTGLISLLLILLPLKNSFRYFFSNGKDSDSTGDFLVITLVGLTVWSSFNVILELPHSSAFYWLVYFSVVYHFSRANPSAA